MADGDTLVNAVLGAVVSVVLTPLVPFAPVVGGVAAGYLEGGDRTAGLRIGAVSGAIALVPLLVLAVVVANVLFVFLAGGMGMSRMVGGLGFLALFLGAGVAAVYTVGLSALGGWLGNYVRSDTGIGGTGSGPGERT
jgi:hypothetical protein